VTPELWGDLLLCAIHRSGRDPRPATAAERHRVRGAMTAATFYACIHCDAAGETTGTESGADVKHAKAAGHATLTSTTQAAALRMAKVAR
jgi:hypothetical protein